MREPGINSDKSLRAHLAKPRQTAESGSAPRFGRRLLLGGVAAAVLVPLGFGIRSFARAEAAEDDTGPKEILLPALGEVIAIPLGKDSQQPYAGIEMLYVVTTPDVPFLYMGATLAKGVKPGEHPFPFQFQPPTPDSEPQPVPRQEPDLSRVNKPYYVRFEHYEAPAALQAFTSGRNEAMPPIRAIVSRPTDPEMSYVLVLGQGTTDNKGNPSPLSQVTDVSFRFAKPNPRNIRRIV